MARRKTTKPRGRAGKRASVGTAPHAVPTPEQQRQMVLLTMERKYRALLHCAKALNLRLADPRAPRTLIETHLADNGIERALLLARHDQIENGVPFHFPSEADVLALRNAIANLETVVARSAAAQAIIEAGNAVVESLPAKKI